MSSPTADGAAFVDDAEAARRRADVRRWRRHSSFIHLCRIALPSTIAFIAAGLAAWVVFTTVAWRFVKTDANQGVSIRMTNPKFYGRSDDNSPFLISAKSAVRDNADYSRVTLDHPVFVINLDAPNQSIVTANQGLYREDTHMLNLDTNLVVDSRTGYHFTTQKAVIDTKTNTVVGDSPVQGAGPLGQISASSYGVDGGGGRMTFNGKVRARINQATRAR